MPTVLSDPSPTFYGILIIVAGALTFVWYRRQTQNNLIRAAAAVLALVAVFVIDRVVESPREEAARKINEMAQASQEKNWDAILAHMSETFAYTGPFGIVIKKDALRDKLKQIDRISEFHGVVILEMHRADYRIIDENHANVGFLTKAKDYPDVEGWYVVANFVKDPDGQWRMQGFNRYEASKTDQRGNALPITGLD